MDTRTQVKQYVDIAWRRKWWLVVPLVVGAAGSLYLYKVAPKLYSANTTVLVSRPNVPEDIVRLQSTPMGEQLRSLTVSISSNQFLTAVARENGLIDENADEATRERVCAQIWNNVSVDQDKTGAWFKITVKNRDPQRAAKIANRLAEMFIDQNAESRVKQASDNTNLIDGWVERKAAELNKKEAEIAQFKQAHMYELPDQQDSTLQLISVSRDRVSHLSGEIQSKQDRLALLQSEDKARRAAAAASGVNVAVDDPDSRALVQLQNELNDLLISYTDENPVVKRKRDQIEQFKATHPTLTAAKASDPADQSSPDVRKLQLELRSLENERSREEAQLQIYTIRLGNMPRQAQELEKLTRGYDVLKKDYETRAGQKEGAQRSQEVEEAKKGQQFKVQDPAIAPANPSEPVLIKFLFLGIVGGLGLGVGAAALLEFLDQSVRSEEQFATLFPDLVVLGTIPNLIEAAPVKPSVKVKSDKNKKKVAAS